MTNLLDSINSPADVSRLPREQLGQLCDEVRSRIIEVVSANGGHFGSNLGTVELTVALLSVYNLAEDVIVWDVGHQAYPFKLLTGRKDRFHTIRQYKGLSGFLRRDESPYDAFNAGHGGTSISAAVGMAKARELQKKPGHVIAVIGDGSMTAGMAFEGLNFTGHGRTKLTVILNDNTWGISPNVGALSAYFARIISGRFYNRFKDRFESLVKTAMPSHGGLVVKALHKGQEFVKGFLTPGIIFEELGFKYVGPVDGHRVDHLVETLENVKQHIHEPVIVHVVTQKGKGYGPAEEDVEKWHGPSPFHIESGTFVAQEKKAPAYTEVFGDMCVELAKQDPRVVTITAAMEKGTGLDKFHQAYPERFFDVGMAEQHAVTMAAGMSCEGVIPIVAVYSTFLQRAFDQIVHDVALTKRPVILALDRGGLVGADGATHHGAFDLSYLRCIPNMVVMAPKDENELRRMMKTAVVRRDGPSAIRYPRGNGEGVALDPDPQPLEIGRGEVLREGRHGTLVAIGKMVPHAMKVAGLLQAQGLEAAVINARFVKPIDGDLIERYARQGEWLVTLEENSVRGGFGSAVAETLTQRGVEGLRLKMVGLPDAYVEHGTVPELWREIGLDAESLARDVLAWARGGARGGRKLAV